jgi:hypothetical protein
MRSAWLGGVLLLASRLAFASHPYLGVANQDEALSLTF